MKQYTCTIFKYGTPIIGLFIGILLVVISFPAYATNVKLPVIRVNLDELSSLQAGLSLGSQSKKLFPNIEKHYDAHLNSLFSPRKFKEVKEKTLPNLLKKVNPEYKEEMIGVVSAWDMANESTPGDGKLSLDEYQLLNFLPDLGLAPGGSGFGVFDSVAANGTVVARNLDWKISNQLRSLQAITVYQYADTTVVSIGFAGLTSILSGFNQQGLFLTLLNAEPYSPYLANNIQIDNAYSSVFDLRKALREYQAISEATYFLQYRYYSFASNVLLADRKTVHVLEYPAGKNGRIRLWNSPVHANRSWSAEQQVAVVGCHLLATLPDNCRDAHDTVRWQRLNQLAVFSQEAPATPQAVSALMLDTANNHFELFNSDTLQSLTYLTASNSLYMYASPAKTQTDKPAQLHAYLALVPTKPKVTQQNWLGNFRGIWLAWALLFLLTGATAWLIWTKARSPDS